MFYKMLFDRFVGFAYLYTVLDMPRQIRIVCLQKVPVLCFVNNGKTQHRAWAKDYPRQNIVLSILQLITTLTFAPVEISLPYLKSCGKQESNVSIGVFWQTFAAVYLSGNDCHVGLYNNVLTNHCLELNGII